MKETKFRQPLRDRHGIFKEWFFWGFIGDDFISPANQLNGLDTRKESQQFTGLKDRTDKEIYEGDIIRTETGYVCEITWSNNKYISNNEFRYGFHANEYPLFNGFGGNIEVIGNIYEHSHLLGNGE